MNSETNFNTNAATAQQLNNLPAEMRDAPRFFPVTITPDGRKLPIVKNWQNPDNQHGAQDMQGLKGFDICGHGRGVDYLFVDFDHVLNDDGKFLYKDAEKWFNFLSDCGETFCERSISGHGLHMFAVPTADKFPTIGSGKNGQIVFDEATGAKIELYYKTRARYCLVTGNLFRCEPTATIPHGEVADEMFQQLLNAIGGNQSARLAREQSAQTDSVTSTGNELEIMRDILRIVDPNQLNDYTEWRNLLFCAKLYGVTVEEFDAFSSRDKRTRADGQPKYNPVALQAMWNSAETAEKLRSDSVKIGTAIKIAEHFGYQPPRKTKYLAGDDKEFVDAIFKGDASDLDFARRLERFCGDRVRWLTDDEKWLIYRRGSIGGGVWQRGSEKNATILPLARELSDFMSNRAGNKHANELVANFKTSRKIGQAVTLLKSLDSILITAEDLNRHTELLNVQNGVIDLSTGELIPAAPELLLTQQINAVFDARADTSTVARFFESIMPDEMTRAGLLRWLGYCLTGETAAEKFAIWIGRTGSNGKGTLSNTILNLFGNYGAGLSPRALLKGGHTADADRATTALNALEGARFAISEEMDMSGELNSSLIKTLAGGDKINLRRLHAEERTLVNSAKLNISGNFMPRIENVHDGGILRRLINFPFKVTFDKPDLTLKRRLSSPENLSALLLILVREAADWYRDNELIISPQMTSSRDALLNASDFVQEFLADNYELGAGLFIKANTLLKHLKDTCAAECRPYTKRADLIQLIEAVDGVSYEFDTHENQHVFKGVGRRQPQNVDGDRIISSADLPPEWQ